MNIHIYNIYVYVYISVNKYSTHIYIYIHTQTHTHTRHQASLKVTLSWLDLSLYINTRTPLEHRKRPVVPIPVLDAN